MIVRRNPCARLASAGIVALASCAGVAGAYEPGTVSDGGSVVGWIRFGDQYPPAEYVKADRDVASCGARHLNETFVVDPETKGLANAVAMLVDVPAGKPFPETDGPRLDQNGCRYEPHVQIAYLPDAAAGPEGTGTELVVLNSDDVFHNVHAFGEAEETVFNVPSIPAKSIEQALKAPGVYQFQCDIHSWMSAWIVVMSHPYGALTDETGSFRIDDVPPGDYTLRIWHEGLGSVEREITVSAGEATAAEFPLGRNE